MESSQSCPVYQALDLQLQGTKYGYEVWRCGRCGTIHASPLPSPEQLERYYNRFGEDAWSSQHGVSGWRRAVQRIRSMRRHASKLMKARSRVSRIKRHVRGGHFLDIGCGVGFTVKAAADAGFRARGIDLSRQALATGQKLFPELELGNTDIEGCGVEPGSLSSVYLAEVIEHLPDPVAFLHKVCESLKRGGVIYLTTPDAGHWRVPKDVIEWRMVCPPNHLVLFTRNSMHLALQRTGFENARLAWTTKRQIRLIARKA
jgi:2-polyprenyl-3-methyl-5-hydroxy-6-metoxy-1,4-benzoquinol methylase